MTDSKDIHWKRVSVEAAAIVASILFAFTIDAWWQDRQEIISDNIHLAAVLTELRKHETLLAEAISAHERTFEAGKELLEITASDRSKDIDSDAQRVITQLINFYQINTPFGALETAMLAGAIPRMRNTDLSSALANWPVAIDDLLEEENQGYVIMFSLLSKLSEQTSMAEIYKSRMIAPTIRGTDETVDSRLGQLPQSPFKFNSESVFNKHEIENELLLLMILAQSAQNEATRFAEQLRTLVERMETCIGDSDC